MCLSLGFLCNAAWNCATDENKKKDTVHGATVISRWLKADGNANAAAFAFPLGVHSFSLCLFSDFVAPKENAPATVG